MRTFSPEQNSPRRRRQGRLLAFGMTGAMAFALSACDNAGNSGQTMIDPPTSFNPGHAINYTSTNQPPQSPAVVAPANYSGYLGGHGYFPVYGFPGYYYRPAPGSVVELISGGSPSYRASSTSEARASVARGGFGGTGGHGFGGGE